MIQSVNKSSVTYRGMWA